MKHTMSKRNTNKYPLLLAGLLTIACAGTLSAAVEARQENETITLSNEKVVLRFDLSDCHYSLTDAESQELILDKAYMGADGRGYDAKKRTRFEWKGWKTSAKIEDISDAFGKGKKVIVSVRDNPNPLLPNYLFSYALHEGSGAVVMGFGVENTRDIDVRLMNVSPMQGATLLPGKKPERQLTLNGSAGAEKAAVKPGVNRDSPNSLTLTCTVDGKRRTVVWGGLQNIEFGKWATLSENTLGFTAADPVGRLVDKGQTYWSNDSFYVDVTTRDPFQALEQYGRAMRVANNARPNVYDFPVLCGWGVGELSKLPHVNNSVKLVAQLEAAQKAGLTKYTKVGIRLEPDAYVGNTEQGWWDDAHWAKFGHLVAPYDTFAKWCAAIRERDGVPYTYFQLGMPSDDYAKAFPDHMLSKDISRLHVYHTPAQPLVTFDYTSKDFQRHMLEVWARLKKDGMRGIKFDYPESAWRPEGGFENRHATTAFAYREAFRLAREGLGPEACLDERILGDFGKPCLELTAGVVDTQRNWGDSNRFIPGMVTIGGLRWYKNRTVFNYYPDSKTVHDCTPEERQAMLTMVYLTSGRIDLATAFTLFTPEITHDFSRIYPAYREPYTARPLDAFTGVQDPQVYDLELTPEWHQVAVFNTSNKETSIEVPFSGDRVQTSAIGLDPTNSYYVYDFWGDSLLGKFAGTEKIAKTLKPGNCAMLSVRKVQTSPQVLSTNRHVLQGWVDLANVQWNAKEKTLSGTAKVIGGEAFRIVVASNGEQPISAKVDAGEAKLEAKTGNDLTDLVLERSDNGDCHWVISYK